MIECLGRDRATGIKCRFKAPHVKALLEHLDDTHGNDYSLVQIGTIVHGADIGLDPKNRWIRVVCMDSFGLATKGCGDERWVRYYGKVQGSTSKRLCQPCNKMQAARGFQFGYKKLYRTHG